MPQVDIVLFLPIVSSLFCVCAVFFSVAMVYLLFSFFSRFKVSYDFLSKVCQVKQNLASFF